MSKSNFLLATVTDPHRPVSIAVFHALPFPPTPRWSMVVVLDSLCDSIGHVELLVSSSMIPEVAPSRDLLYSYLTHFRDGLPSPPVGIRLERCRLHNL